ncbi:hypothetical protein PU629_10535 [Pullulanibacillus sp. KACC 23026]|uniref:hypothetical protein n=1 Tax=Pullulanibacillus sp. KACC 23026 TaxID=3028315 RepID=UPI0023AFD610|nr:hypothetical protein [Pullulanibacillus sp. KACC 23026]WEG14749.1 hypothetical protein PU629_10535 [Pullulanibacillus sp. KACC 23026]
MKKIVLGIFYLVIIPISLIGCSSSITGSGSSASWSYSFVVVNGVHYGVSDKDSEVQPSEVGQKLGKVKRNVVNMDAGASNGVLKNFDSNYLDKGTKLYEDKLDTHAIVYEKEGKYYLAKGVKKSSN